MDRSRINMELSIVIPALNEATALPRLLEGLALQKGVTGEVIISDGGSEDGTAEKLGRSAHMLPFPVTLIRGATGRGSQLNRGADAAKGDYLLFLHADSSFADSSAFRSGLDCLRDSCGSGGHCAAGKFRLRFRRSGEGNAFGYFFYESKARLLRPECTHGDQGMLLHRRFFEALGGFDEFPPMLAETRFAEKVRKAGKWVLLPSEIGTSARRFEREGLKERQTLNAIIMNFASLGWEQFFRDLPGLYPPYVDSRRLPLDHILRRIRALIFSLPPKEQLSLWLRTGGYVRSNAWQLAYALDARRNFRRGLEPGRGDSPCLDFYDRSVHRLLNNGVCDLITSVMVWIWFHAAMRPKLRNGN